MQKPLCKSKNGVTATYDPIHSHAATHLQDTPELKDLVIEVVASLNLTGQKIARHFDLGRIVGTTDVVAVDDTDEMVYGMRKNREDDGLVPFTKTRRAKPCSYVTIQLAPQNDGTYELTSAWIGTFDDDDEPFPQSPNATERSVEYWRHWAFVYGSQEIVPGTETKICPW